jgi:DnaJ-class molecular chaperone
MIKAIQVTVTKYQTEDGQIHDTESDAMIHERFVSGLRKVCDGCGGAGRVDPYGDGRQSVTCPTCRGKKFLEKSEVWT